jgi:hypothetical protein
MVDSSNVVAIVSVVVTGVVSPLLALLTVRWQASQKAVADSNSDRRAALEQLASELVRFMRINGTFVAMCRKRAEDAVALQECANMRNVAQDGLLAAYGRVSVRFGSESEVMQAYLLIDAAVRHFNRIAYEPYLRREVPSASDGEFDEAFAEITAAKFALMDAAHGAMQNVERKRRITHYGG